ncbi:MAG: ribbon-helix-helix protein, CopG family [Acidobacteriota bacterium]
MIRTQIQLDEEQYERLRALAAGRSQSVAQLVREGVDLVLDEADRGRSWEGLWKAAGTCHDPEGGDVSVRHDDHLAKAFGR